jgi:hypothetical protein
MPRTKKPAGQVVDRRNGRRTEIAAGRLAPFALPRRTPAWRLEVRRAWAALRDDDVWQVLTAVDRPVLLRWADALQRAEVALEAADKMPTVKGSMGQIVENPQYMTAERALKMAQACEAQIGVGALNRAKLGLAVLEQKRSLMDLNAAFLAESTDDPDPRLH